MSMAVLCMLLASLAAGAALLELVASPPARGSWRPRARSAARRPGEPPPARWAARPGTDEQTERLLDAAGRFRVVDAASLAARRRVAALTGGLWAAALGLMLVPVGLAIGLGFAGAAVGRAVPGLLLVGAARRRTAALQREVPELLDLLAVGLACGLPTAPALRALAEWGRGALAEGAGRAAAELALGAGIDQSLDRLVREHPVPELEAAVAVLRRSRRHGTGAAEPIRALASGARQSRARRAMDHAAKAAPRIQLVAALLLVPAALCVLAAALVAGGVGGSGP